MRHNPTTGLGNGGKPLAAMGCWNAPNLLVLTRRVVPAIPGMEAEEDQEQLRDEEEPTGDGGKRELCGMSVKSGLNLARLLSSLDWRKHGECLHVSLTYGRRFPRTKEELRAIKAELVAYVGRYAADPCGIWRLEYQLRLAPHFHLLLWVAMDRAESFADWVVHWWKHFSENPSRFGCKVTSGDQARGTWYLAMHAAKRTQSPPFRVGRWWGYINRAKLLEAVDIHHTGTVSERERVWYARLYRRATGCKVRHEQGFSWFLPLAWQCEVRAWIQKRVASEIAERNRPKDPF